jgi:hypothetical protein
MVVRLCSAVLLGRIIKKGAVDRIAEAFFEGGDCPHRSLIFDFQSDKESYVCEYQQTMSQLFFLLVNDLEKVLLINRPGVGGIESIKYD